MATKVNCYDEQYIYAGVLYGPGKVEIEDTETAKALKAAVERREHQRQIEDLEKTFAEDDETPTT